MKKHVFEIKGLRKTLRVSWTAKKNDWVFSKAKVKRELLDTVKARKPAYDGHTMRNLGSCLAKEIMQGTMPGARRRGRPRTAWMDNIMTWTGLPVEESVRMSVCVCVCVCVCLSTIMSSDLYTSDLRHFFALATYGPGWVLLWRRSDTLCTSGFMDDAIFANKPRLLDVAAQLKRNAHAALGLAISCAQ